MSFLWVVSPSHMTRNVIFRIPPFRPSCLTTSPTAREITSARHCSAQGSVFCSQTCPSVCPRGRTGLHGEMGSTLPSYIHSTNTEMPIINPTRFHVLGRTPMTQNSCPPWVTFGATEPQWGREAAIPESKSHTVSGKDGSSSFRLLSAPLQQNPRVLKKKHPFLDTQCPNPYLESKNGHFCFVGGTKYPEL